MNRSAFLALCLSAALLLPAAAYTGSEAAGENSAPIAEALTLETYKNVAVYGQCSAIDPDGDLVTYRLVDKPARGTVTLNEDGSFCYTPYENKKGKDSFTYAAVDSFGNESRRALVKVTILKSEANLSYSDMAGHTAHYAAIRLAEEGIFTGIRVCGDYCFDPEATVTRSEFLAMAMTASGADALENVTVTGFYDDDAIPTWSKGYVSAAVMAGTVQGRATSSGQIRFHGADAITAAEAAVILNRLLGTADVASTSVFAADSVPTWAWQSAVNLEAVDVISPTLSFEEPLNRAEAAEMLCAALDVLERRESSKSFW